MTQAASRFLSLKVARLPTDAEISRRHPIPRGPIAFSNYIDDFNVAWIVKRVDVQPSSCSLHPFQKAFRDALQIADVERNEKKGFSNSLKQSILGGLIDGWAGTSTVVWKVLCEERVRLVLEDEVEVVDEKT